MDIGILSDSHIPSRASAIPGEFVELIESVDHVIHAGDFDSTTAYEQITNHATALTAVAGNMDHTLDLPTIASVELEGQEFVVTHGTGSISGYRSRVASLVRDQAASDRPIGVAGHTHDPLDTVVDGIRLLNPGSVTGADPAEQATMFTATIDGDTVAVDRHHQ